MKTHHVNRETPVVTEDVRRIAALTAAIRVLCIINRVQLQRQRFITVIRPPHRNVQIDFTGRVPLGFAFPEGHEATFHVPSGHRFVIEQMDISCTSGSVDVQLVTRSRRMFRSLTVTDWLNHAPSTEEPGSPSAAPIQVHGSSASTFMFGNGALHNSSTVPPDTYVQVWGYLEPAYDAERF
jgi:hypothetical protein